VKNLNINFFHLTPYNKVKTFHNILDYQHTSLFTKIISIINNFIYRFLKGHALTLQFPAFFIDSQQSVHIILLAPYTVHNLVLNLSCPHFEHLIKGFFLDIIIKSIQK